MFIIVSGKWCQWSLLPAWFQSYTAEIKYYVDYVYLTNYSANQAC